MGTSRKGSSARWLIASLLLSASGLAVSCGGTKTDNDAGSDANGEDEDNVGVDGVDGDSGQGGNGAANCGGVAVEAEPAQVQVLLVIDKSASMEDKPAGFTKNKWDTLVSSLETALGEVEKSVAFGLKLYPDANTSADACGVQSSVPIGVSLNSLPEIKSALNAVNEGSGQTPTAAALSSAYDYYVTGAGKNLPGTKYVLLATDGGPNCNPNQDSCVAEGCGNPYAGGCLEEAKTCTINLENRCEGSDCPAGSVCLEPEYCLDDQATLSQVVALDEMGIKTIVVGMSGSEAYGKVLDDLAVAGKLPASTTSPKYHKVTDGAGLTQTLRDITRTVIRSCEIQLKEQPPALDKVNVFLDGEVIPKSDDNGWKFDPSTTPPTVLLTGTVCSSVETKGVSSISVEFGCPTVTVR